MKYKRYMVFEWVEYDNSAPFDCMEASFDSLDEAEAYIINMIDGVVVEEDDYDKYCGWEKEIHNYYCVFDRVEGEIVYKCASEM